MESTRVSDKFQQFESHPSLTTLAKMQDVMIYLYCLGIHYNFKIESQQSLG